MTETETETTLDDRDKELVQVRYKEYTDYAQRAEPRVSE